jgi:hypothetical protein
VTAWIIFREEAKMSEPAQNQLVADLARDLVAQVAPQELPVFRANSAAYFRDPRKALTGHTGKDDMLGFGVGNVVGFLTPVVLSVLTDVVQYLSQEVSKNLQTESAPVIQDAVKRLFKKFRSPDKAQEQAGAQAPAQEPESAPPVTEVVATAAAAEPQAPSPAVEATLPVEPPAPVVAVTPAQIKQVWQMVHDKAIVLKMADSKAKLLADTVAGGLVTA